MKWKKNDDQKLREKNGISFANFGELSRKKASVYKTLETMPSAIIVETISEAYVYPRIKFSRRPQVSKFSVHDWGDKDDWRHRVVLHDRQATYIGWRAGRPLMHAGVNYIPLSGTMNLAEEHRSRWNFQKKLDHVITFLLSFSWSSAENKKLYAVKFLLF
jgi:hypothetical protein